MWSHGKSGYMVVRRNGKNVMHHRVVWEEAYGPIPYGKEIDHINGIRHDNRLDNLRLVTRSQNQFNRANVKGFSWHKRKKKWEAQIKHHGKKIFLGYHSDLIDARAAYLRKYKEINGENFNGRI